MTNRAGLRCAVLCAAVLCGAGGAAAAEQDVSGSRDPNGIERFPHSWIVAYERDDDVLPRALVTSRVDRVRRELRVQDQVQVDASLESVTWQVPDGVAVADVVEHFRQELAGDVLFTCTGRACGRSADWAHQVFEQSLLYGPDANQQYRALEWRGRYVSLYVNERGNKRVYAHLQVLDPHDGHVAADDLPLARRLAERGWTVVDEVSPGVDGSLGPGADAILQAMGEELTELAAGRVFVVCHLYGSSDADALLAASDRCARQAADLLLRGAGVGEGRSELSVQPFGAGPLLPRRSPPQSRLELVLPLPGPSGPR